VYLATLEEATGYGAAGEQVAVKVLKPQHLASANVLRRFRREAEVGQRIRHPNVIRTLAVDSLEQEGQHFHFLILEYFEGRTLRELMRQVGPLPEPLLRDLATQVASGLEAIHEVGVAHRDLKPGNLLITADYRLKIMDLGVAFLHEEGQRLTRDGHFVGTLLYASPEQVRGETVGPASDLYSLGTVLYEAATTIQPFEADSGPATVKRQLYYVPPLAGDLNPQISSWMEELIGCLLEKRAERRFASSCLLRQILTEGEASAWWQRRQQELAVSTEQRQVERFEVERETPFVGRFQELQTLRTYFQDLRAGRGRALLVEGEAGVGKSRLLNEFVRQLHEEGEVFRLLYGCAEASGTAGGSALARSILEFLGPEEAEDALGRYLGATPHLAPAFARWLRNPNSLEGGPPLDAQALEGLLGYFATVVAADRPTLWILEDLHLASDQELLLFASLAEHIQQQPLLLIASQRSWSREPRIQPAVAALQRMPLRRLSRRQVSGLLKDLLNTQAAAGTLGRYLSTRSDGNPFFIVEMIRELRQRAEQEAADSDTAQESVELPESVRQLLLHQLKGLAPERQRLLEVAAVYGSAFDPDLVARVLAIHPLQALETLAQAETENHLVRSTGNTFSFDHPQLREVLYACQDVEERKSRHLALAEAFLRREGLEDLPPTQLSGKDLAFLAEHFLFGREPARSLPYLQGALAHLTAQYQHELLLRLIPEALEACRAEDVHLRFEILRRQSACLLLRGRLQWAHKAAEEGLGLAQAAGSSGPRAQAYLSLAQIRAVEGDLGAGLELAQKGLELVEPTDALSLRAELLSVQGQGLVQSGRLGEALAVAEELVGLGRPGQADLATAAGLALEGWVRLEEGEAEQAREILERAIAGLRSLHRLPEQARAMLLLAQAHRNLLDPEEARREVERGLAVARNAGDVSCSLDFLAQLASLALEEGDLESAERIGGTTLQTARVRRLHRQQARCLRILGELARAKGQAAEAEQKLTEALHLEYRLGHVGGIAQATFALGRHYLRGRNSGPAEPLLEEASGLVRDHRLAIPGPLPELYLCLLRQRAPPPVNLKTGPALQRAEAYLLLHRIEGVEAHLEEALKLLEGFGEMLDGERRERFWATSRVARVARRRRTRGAPDVPGDRAE
jgi:tetratricopeptide (TPR) repeat protein/tRNA A-37 threonylcarbamoyl transferase component Bud32